MKDIYNEANGKINEALVTPTTKSNEFRKLITFSVTRYFDPYGDGRSEHKFFDRKFHRTYLSEDEVRERYREESYYHGVTLVFKPYKRTTLFK